MFLILGVFVVLSFLAVIVRYKWKKNHRVNKNNNNNNNRVSDYKHEKSAKKPKGRENENLPVNGGPSLPTVTTAAAATGAATTRKSPLR